MPHETRKMDVSYTCERQPFHVHVETNGLTDRARNRWGGIYGAIYGMGGILLLQTLVKLFCYWSVDVRCAMRYVRVERVEDATTVKITPVKFSGKKELVDLQWNETQEGKKQAEFEFRKQRFLYQLKNECFEKLHFPTKKTFQEYMNSRGYGKDADVSDALRTYGFNKFTFPKASFGELLKEQMLAPFFLFQMLCVALWFLDEMWYFSMFTLLMLVVFECTVVGSRIRSLNQIRQISSEPYPLLVHRGGKWVSCSPDLLVPGDVVSFKRPIGEDADEKTIGCDLLLLAGTCITNEAMLTGESTPQRKTPVSQSPPDEHLQMKHDKHHIIFGGTKILQHEADYQNVKLRTPDGGCLAYVLRTGFDTAQGKLMRTILFSTERVTANNWEAGMFILFLLIFALAAAAYVWHVGSNDPARSTFKLILNCSLIITSVIPPELPMELSIAVNSSLVALSKRGVFCTEPYRIPFAGKVDTCCFDKTGTLTSDELIFEGIAMEKGAETPPESIQRIPAQVLAACQALVLVDNKLVGDPLECAAMSHTGWSLGRSDDLKNTRDGTTMKIVQRHHFSSELKRMAVLAKVVEPGSLEGRYWAFVKGAPEVLKPLLRDAPEDYDKTYKHHAQDGARVIALAYKPLAAAASSGEVLSLEREAVESGLEFAGFALFTCPLKPESEPSLRMLMESSHHLIMITGDASLTACHAAALVHIVQRNVLILERTQGNNALWTSVDETFQIPFSPQAGDILDLACDYDLCVEGGAISIIEESGSFEELVPFVQVWARTSPQQKESILRALRHLDRTTLMCGDGTNDVGALKTSHVGVALLSTESVEKIKELQNLSPMERYKKIKEHNEKQKQRRKPSGSQTGASTSWEERMREQMRQHPNEKVREMLEQMEAEGDGQAPMVKLGDASMAAPFTARAASVEPVSSIIRQGRCTLVTTLQMFKILGLNCLSNAYVLSVLYLDGVKLGDTQATVSGMLSAALFLFLSHAKPLDRLSAQRPYPNVFSPYLLLSILGQFAVHLTFLILSVRGALSHLPPDWKKPEPDTDFSPNIVNTVSYMANMMIQISTFAVNYVGHPFNTSIRENKGMWYSLMASVIFFVTIASDNMREFNTYLELVPLPETFRDRFLLMAFADFVLSYGVEHAMRFLFPAPHGPRARPVRSEKKDKNL